MPTKANDFRMGPSTGSIRIAVKTASMVDMVCIDADAAIRPEIWVRWRVRVRDLGIDVVVDAVATKALCYVTSCFLGARRVRAL